MMAGLWHHHHHQLLGNSTRIVPRHRGDIKQSICHDGQWKKNEKRIPIDPTTTVVVVVVIMMVMEVGVAGYKCIWYSQGYSHYYMIYSSTMDIIYHNGPSCCPMPHHHHHHHHHRHPPRGQ